MLSVYMRRDFPALGLYRSYLNTAFIGLMPRTVRDQGVRLLVEYVSDPLTKNLEAREKYLHTRTLLARYIGIEDPDRLTLLSQGTTSCIERTVLSALATLSSRNSGSVEIVTTAYEYPGVLLAIQSLCQSLKGLCSSVRIVGEEGGYRWEDSVLSVMDDYAPVVVVASSIEWVSGYRGNVGLLASRAEKNGSVLVVDGAHHFGHLPLTPSEKRSHAICGTVKKWLLAPVAGLGIAYYSERMTREFIPYSYSLHHVSTPVSLKDVMGGRSPSFVETADRFSSLSRPSEFSIELFYEVVKYLLYSTSIVAVQDHIMGLRKILVDLLADKGFSDILEGEPFERKTGIVLVQTGLSPGKEERLAKMLSKVGVSVSYREQHGIHGIRVSIHLYNNEQDLQVFVDELAGAVKSIA